MDFVPDTPPLLFIICSVNRKTFSTDSGVQIYLELSWSFSDFCFENSETRHVNPEFRGCIISFLFDEISTQINHKAGLLSTISSEFWQRRVITPFLFEAENFNFFLEYWRSHLDSNCNVLWATHSSVERNVKRAKLRGVIRIEIAPNDVCFIS